MPARLPSSPPFAGEIVIPNRDDVVRFEPLQVTLKEAARLLAYDLRTIQRLISRSERPSVGAGRLRRIPVQALRDYQQRHLTK